MMLSKKFATVLLIILIFAAFPVISKEVVDYNKYAYSQLSDKERLVYDEISRAVFDCCTEIRNVLPTGRENSKILSAFLDDNPGCFWVENKLLFYEEKGSYCIKLFYTHQENFSFDVKRFFQLVSSFHSHIKNDANDWIKLYHIYDYLASTIIYDNDYTDQSMWSVFFDGVGVCAGFARSFQYLARQEDIPCLLVHGYEIDKDGIVGAVGHVWVMAQINGVWYQFDPTWGLVDTNGNVDFTYFCRSGERMNLTHKVANDYPLPDCPDDNLSYAHMRKRYMSVYSQDNIGWIINNAFSRGEMAFTLEFGDALELERAYEDLITNKSIFSFFKEAGYRVESLLYSINRQNFSLKISIKTYEELS